jgi:hypothetical protein
MHLGSAACSKRLLKAPRQLHAAFIYIGAASGGASRAADRPSRARLLRRPRGLTYRSKPHLKLVAARSK